VIHVKGKFVVKTLKETYPKRHRGFVLFINMCNLIKFVVTPAHSNKKTKQSHIKEK
jgi:hypothetical protein